MMIWQIVKKQALILWRNPTQLFLLLGLPVILIAILGTALGSTMDGGSPSIKVKIAFIEHEDENSQMNRFLDDLAVSGLPAEAVQVMQKNVEQAAPIHLLKDIVFESKELEDIVDVKSVKVSEKEDILNDDSYTAVIEVPENFTYETLQSMILQKEVQPQLKLYQNEGSQIGSSVVENVLRQFQEQLTLETNLGQYGINYLDLQQTAADTVTSEIKTINQKETVSTKSYYAVGMAAMNVFFIASAISSIAYTEKKIHVFDRIILADVSRWVYFIGIFLTGTIFGLLQLLIIFGFSWIVFGVDWPDLPSFFAVTISYAVAIGGITVLLTAINYRLNSEMISNFFSSVIVTLLSFLGGSFYPIGDYSKTIQKLGDYTPNGAGMAAYLKILRGDGFTEINQYLLYLVLFSAAMIILAAFSFPKRGAHA